MREREVINNDLKVVNAMGIDITFIYRICFLEFIYSLFCYNMRARIPSRYFSIDFFFYFFPTLNLVLT